MSKSYTEDEQSELKYAAKRIIEIIDGKVITEKTQQSGEWKKLDPTEKQIKILKENGFSTDNITRGQASEIIDRLFKESKK